MQFFSSSVRQQKANIIVDPTNICLWQPDYEFALIEVGVAHIKEAAIVLQHSINLDYIWNLQRVYAVFMSETYIEVSLGDKGEKVKEIFH